MGDAVGNRRTPELGQVLALGKGVQDFLGQRQGIGKVTDNERFDMPGLHQFFGFFKDQLQVERDHHIGPGIARDMAELGYGVERIAIDDDPAGAEHGVIGDRIKRRIGQHQGDAGALLDPKLVLQRARQRGDLFGQVAKSGRAAQKIESHRERVPRARGEHLLVNRTKVQLDVPHDPFGITGDPWALRQRVDRRFQGFLQCRRGRGRCDPFAQYFMALR